MSGADPIFLKRSHVMELHDISLERHGGQAGLREPGLVDSALASAKNTFFLGGGNKRTAVAAALTFLELNAVHDTPSEDALHQAMIDIANRQLNKTGLAELLRSVSKSGK